MCEFTFTEELIKYATTLSTANVKEISYKSLCKVLDTQEMNLSVYVNTGTTNRVNILVVVHVEHVKSF